MATKSVQHGKNKKLDSNAAEAQRSPATGSGNTSGGGSGKLSTAAAEAQRSTVENQARTQGSYSGGSSGGGGGSSARSGTKNRNASPTIANAVNAVNTVTGITSGYNPVGTYNDADLRAQGGSLVDQLNRYKTQYESAKARGNEEGMRLAHAAAEAIRAQYGYSGGGDGSERLAAGGGGASGGGAAGQMQFGLRPGVDANGYFDGSTAYYKILDNGWRVPNTFSQGSLKPGDPFYVDMSGGYGWGDNDTPMIARTVDGEPYEIGTTKGRNFIFDSKPGDTMTGGDGSVWTKNADDSTTIRTKDGKTFILGPGGASALPPGSGGAGGQGSGSMTGTGAMDQAAQRLQQGDMPAQQSSLPGMQGQAQTPAWSMPTFNYTPFDQTEAGQAARAEYDALLQRLNDYQAFQYDPNTDPLYQQYADSYTRSGQRAMSDVLGQLAARTGGMASSYAGTMAQQQYDQYMQELANKVPELRQLAYSMYADDYNRLLGQYDRGYARYADDFNRYMDQARFNYDVFADAAKMDYQTQRDAVLDSQWAREMALRELQNAQNYGLDSTRLGYDIYSDQRNYNRDVYTNDRNYNRDVYENDRNFDYGKEQDQKSWDWKQTEFDYQKEQDARQWALTERQYADSLKAELRDRVDRYGYMPTEQDAAAYGLTAAELAALQAQAKHVRAADASRYYSGW